MDAVASPDFSLVKRAVARCSSGHKEIQAAYVFGSMATGQARPDSDIDVAVLLNERVPPSRMLSYRLKLMAELSAALHRPDIDAVILNQATPLLAHRVLSQGKLVFERSASARIRFQVLTANRYADMIPMFETHIRYLKQTARKGRVRG